MALQKIKAKVASLLEEVEAANDRVGEEKERSQALEMRVEELERQLRSKDNEIGNLAKEVEAEKGKSVDIQARLDATLEDLAALAD